MTIKLFYKAILAGAIFGGNTVSGMEARPIDAFYDGLRYGKIEVLRPLLTKNPSLVRQYHPEHNCPPIIAAMHLHDHHKNGIVMFKLLREFGADFNAVFPKSSSMPCNMTPLSYALYQLPYHEDCIDPLIECEADPKHPSIDRILEHLRSNEYLDDPIFQTRYSIDRALKKIGKKLLVSPFRKNDISSLDVFMDNLTKKLSQTAELLKFDPKPINLYHLRKDFSDKINFTKGIKITLQLINSKVSNNNIFLTFDRFGCDCYARVRSQYIAENDKLTTFRLGIYDKLTYTMVGLMDIALASTYQQFFLDILGVSSVSKNPRIAYLGEIIIDEEYRGQRYCSKALELLNEFLDLLGAEFTYLQVVSQMPYAASTYKKAGYVLNEKSLNYIQENSHIDEGTKLKKVELKKEEAKSKFLENSSISQPYMIRYRSK